MTDELGRSIQQDLLAGTTCFGCGPANPKGLRLASYPEHDGPGVWAAFTPWPEHDNGLGFLNGGIISTLLDCHSAAAVLLEADRRGIEALPGAPIAYVTAGLDVRFLRPAPLHEPIQLRAYVVDPGEDAMTAEVELLHGDKVRATATAVWKRWRPRPA